MTAAIVKVENLQVKTNTGVFGDSLIERFAKFAGVSESSRQTYTKCLRQMFRYLADNTIEVPTRDNLVDWLEVMKVEGDTPHA